MHKWLLRAVLGCRRRQQKQNTRNIALTRPPTLWPTTASLQSARLRRLLLGPVLRWGLRRSFRSGHGRHGCCRCCCLGTTFRGTRLRLGGRGSRRGFRRSWVRSCGRGRFTSRRPRIAVLQLHRETIIIVLRTALHLGTLERSGHRRITAGWGIAAVPHFSKCRIEVPTCIAIHFVELLPNHWRRVIKSNVSGQKKQITVFLE
mmetsp:Transcript_23981/g.58215  ORF Transcript_23981/g.58215 Transcript_23981/m.58215 type:complete len:203 (+) Transcript_23981:32-640(+)